MKGRSRGRSRGRFSASLAVLGKRLRLGLWEGLTDFPLIYALLDNKLIAICSK
jgi:hypothetical protein